MTSWNSTVVRRALAGLGICLCLSLTLLIGSAARAQRLQVPALADLLTPADADLRELHQQSTVSRTLRLLENETRLSEFEAAEPFPRSGDAPVAITFREADQTLSIATHRPLTPLASTDPLAEIETGGLEATAIHLDLISRGLDAKSMIKLWLVGPLFSANGRPTIGLRAAHTAIAVRGLLFVDSLGSGTGRMLREWWVIDPEVGRVVNAREWYEHFQLRSFAGAPDLFITAPTRARTETSEYKPERLLDPASQDQEALLMRAAGWVGPQSRQTFGRLALEPHTTALFLACGTGIFSLAK